jgi:hypothetical protein
MKGNVTFARVVPDPVWHSWSWVSCACRLGLAHKLLVLAGPVGVSAINFSLAALAFRYLSALEFGVFSFAMVISAFCMSSIGALVGLPMTGHPSRRHDDDLLWTVGLWLALGMGATTGGIVLSITGSASPSLALSLHTVALCIRVISRSARYSKGASLQICGTELSYAAGLGIGLTVLLTQDTFDLIHIAWMLALCGWLALFTCPDARRAAFFQPASKAVEYIPVWKDTSAWAFLGVITSEFSSNAQAYVVTALMGPATFGLLALGGLIARPINLISKTLIDSERAVISRLLAEGRSRKAWETAGRIRRLSLSLWSATAVTCAGILWLRPEWLTNGEYDRYQVTCVVALSLAALLVRLLRAPQALIVQSSGQFRPLATTGMASAGLALGVTSTLAVFHLPVASMLGPLAGDILAARKIHQLAQPHYEMSRDELVYS